MSWVTLAPLSLMLALGTVLGRAPLPLHPSWSARLLATTCATTAVAALGTGAVVSVNYAATLAPAAAGRVPEWALFGDDSPVPHPVGLPAALLTAAGLLAVARTAAAWRAELRGARAQMREPLATDVPIALAVPGRRGGVVLSRGMLRGFTAEELHVVLQHETSHLRHRHHRYAASGALLRAVLPPLRPLSERLRLAVERWADEDAAEAVGDRALVARTIAKAALAHPPAPGPAGAFADSGVVQRVEALLGAPPGRNTVTGPLLCMGNGFVTSSLTSVTLHLDHAAACVLPLLAAR
ncbi:peptidase M48-like protein [Actinomadura hallensis]|uniref:Peptidase M48-like protein n=1 Tax=Actinomadura hallensis TaxID=337895 RepID=A0A543I8Y4_9ACTN|nr:M56 family metallopeptidase [Actinomadura hallensis]TQM67052.1 peptidase M48-like protein [Actinomadura hallensis]HLV74315.1 M56 family metallopeptidase [Vulgatibacteraceae bacterium]